MATHVARRGVFAVGSQLVNIALARWAPRITDRAFRVLIRMASVALDTPENGIPAATYFGGDELLMLTLKDGDVANVETSRRMIRRAISDLVSVGAVEVIERGSRSRRAVYLLALDRDPPFANPDTRVREPGHQSPRTRTPESANPDTRVTPTTRTTTTTDSTNHSVTLRTHVQTARERQPTTQIVPVSRVSECPKCGTYRVPNVACFRCNEEVP